MKTAGPTAVLKGTGEYHAPGGLLVAAHGLNAGGPPASAQAAVFWNRLAGVAVAAGLLHALAVADL